MAPRCVSVCGGASSPVGPDASVRVLFLSDTHLGFDTPRCARIARRRRGVEFTESLERAFDIAVRARVDLIVHGGDLFYRSRVPIGLAAGVIDRLGAVARRVPIIIVPGNHERSAMPYPLLWNRPGVHVCDHPRTIRLTIRGQAVAVGGFPYSRLDLRRHFGRLVRATGALDIPADVRLLCMHQLIEGAAVGLHGYRFGNAPDVVPAASLPAGFAAVLAGHLHRGQVLRSDRRGRPLAAPVCFAGSTQRTSFAERGETKGVLTLRFVRGAGNGGRLDEVRMHPLHSRPMHIVSMPVDRDGSPAIERLRRRLRELEPDSIVQVRGPRSADGLNGAWPSAATLRALAGPRMNVSFVPARPVRTRGASAPA